MVWSIFEHECDLIDVKKLNLAGVPTLKFRSKGATGLLPTVIMYHGWHSSKEFNRFEAMTLAAQGYQVFVPDALYHGDRGVIDYDTPGVIDKTLWPIILQSVNESDPFISAIIEEHEADPSRMGLMGTSMGAITAGSIFAKHSQLKCFVGFIGTLAWEEATQRGILPEKAMLQNEILSNDPLSNPEALAERPILMCHGKGDTSIPYEIQSYCYEQLKPYYKLHPERLLLLGWDDLPHSVTMSMFQQGVMWLKDYL